MAMRRAIYDGLLAEVYDDYTDADRLEDIAVWRRLAARCDGPVLELACGTGRVLLPLLAEGYAAEGLDNSDDMLARCRNRAAAVGLAPLLHQADMTDFALGRRFSMIFCAAGSLTLLAEPRQMEAALDRSREHLVPGGLLALAMDDPGSRTKETIVARDLWRGRDGARLRCILDPRCDDDPEVTRFEMTNEVVTVGGAVRRETTGIAFRRPDPARLATMLYAAGFREIELRNADGTGPAQREEATYIALARTRW